MTEAGEEHPPQKEPAVARPPDQIDAGLEDDEDLFETEPEVTNECRCGECCRRMIIDVDVQDAKREPRIAERGSPIYTPPELTASGQRELEGFNLNDKTKNYACTFLDTTTNLCSIYESGPWVCRVFD